MSMCMTTRPSEYHNMLADITKAEIVYSKDHEGGTLYALIHTRPEKRHSALDKNITSLDSILKTCTNTSTTYFKSISDQYEGKVKTFENSEHIEDPLFHVIFNVHQSGAAIGRKYNIQPGVQQYTKVQDPQQAINQEQLDLIIQKNAEGTQEHSTTKKRPRTDEVNDGASGSVDPGEELEKTKEALAAKNEEITLLQNDIVSKEATIAAKDNEIAALKSDIDARKKTDEADTTVATLIETNAKNIELENRVAALEQEGGMKDNDIAELKARDANYVQKFRTQEDKIRTLEADIKEKNTQLKGIHRKFNDDTKTLQSNNSNMREELANYRRTYGDEPVVADTPVLDTPEAKDEHIHKLTTLLAQKDARISHISQSTSATALRDLQEKLRQAKVCEQAAKNATDQVKAEKDALVAAHAESMMHMHKELNKKPSNNRRPY